MYSENLEIFIEDQHLRDRAYYIFIHRIEHNIPGDHVSDWLQALSECQSNTDHTPTKNSKKTQKKTTPNPPVQKKPKRQKKDKNTDLTLIHGIGKVISKSLNQQGIYKITEFAKLSQKKLDEFCEKYEYQKVQAQYDWLKDAKQLIKIHKLK